MQCNVLGVEQGYKYSYLLIITTDYMNTCYFFTCLYVSVNQSIKFHLTLKYCDIKGQL